MANFKKHLAVGAIVGTVTGAGKYLSYYLKDKEKNPETMFQWGQFIQLLLTG